MAENQAEIAQPTLRLVTERHASMSPHLVEVTWAVAVLDDGTEIRMRHLGDRVEVRGWDSHIVDVSAAETEPNSPPGSTGGAS